MSKHNWSADILASTPGDEGFTFLAVPLEELDHEELLAACRSAYRSMRRERERHRQDFDFMAEVANVWRLAR